MTHFLIVSSNQNYTAEQWQKKLLAVRGKIFPEDTIVLSVHEDWDGGAGNALGTLYAFEKATKMCKQIYNIDLLSSLRKGASAFLYHTAGQGKRLAPLVFAENNNKGSVQLPSHLLGRISDTGLSKDLASTISILEAVIHQTFSLGCETSGHIFSGRLACFWGDQIFLPEHPLAPPQEHMNIFSRYERNKKTWEGEFGLTISTPEGTARHLDKVNFDTLQKLEKSGVVPPRSKINVSLGSFSLSWEMLEALMEEFRPELETKEGKFDADPHLWMPATLDEKTYSFLMDQRGEGGSKISKHWSRIQKFLEKFTQKHGKRPLFGATEIGENSDWWDFGTVSHFFYNILKLIENSPGGDRFRNFLKLNFSTPAHLTCEGNNIFVNCNIRSGHVQNSVLVNVKADSIVAKNCVIINVNLNSLKGENALLYHVRDSAPLVLPKNTVRTDLWHKDKMRIYTTLDRNGKSDWKEHICDNRYSYDEISRLCTHS